MPIKYVVFNYRVVRNRGVIRTCTALVFMVTSLEHAIDVCIYGNIASEIPVYIRAMHI